MKVLLFKGPAPVRLTLFKYASCGQDLRFVSGGHNSPVYDECQTQSVKDLALPREWAYQEDSNNIPKIYI